MKIPTIKEVYSDSKPAEGTLLSLLNEPVNQQWLKEHDTYIGHYYLPIEKVTFLLKKIFPNKHKIEILYSNIVYGVAWMNVRVHFFNYDTELWDYVDGSAALKIGADTDATFQKLRSEATKSACKLLGRIFGGDLNRIEIDENGNSDKWSLLKSLYEDVFNRLKPEDIEPLLEIIKNKRESVYNKTLTKLKRLQKPPKKDIDEKTNRQNIFIAKCTSLEMLGEINYFEISEKATKNLYNAKKRELKKKT